MKEFLTIVSLLQQLTGKDHAIQTLKQEELPLDPDEIGELVQEDNSTPASDASQSQPSVSGNQTVESMDTTVSSETSVVPILPSVSENSLNSHSQSLICDTKVPNSTPVQPYGGESLARVETNTAQPIIDLTMEESEPNRHEDQFDDFMDDLDDEDFCSSFVNFDDDKGECDPPNYKDNDREYVPPSDDESEDEESGSSDGEEWRSEGVEYVKTVAEMAEEANTKDLFDPKVLGKSFHCKYYVATTDQ